MIRLSRVSFFNLPVRGCWSFFIQKCRLFHEASVIQLHCWMMDEPWTNPVSLHAGIPSEHLWPRSTMGLKVNVWLWIMANRCEEGALANAAWKMKVCWNKAGQPCLAQMVQENENKSNQTSLTKDAKGGPDSSPIHPCLLLALGDLASFSPCCESKAPVLWLLALKPGAAWEQVTLSLGASGFMMPFLSLWGPAGNSAKTVWACSPFLLPRRKLLWSQRYWHWWSHLNDITKTKRAFMQKHTKQLPSPKLT